MSSVKSRRFRIGLRTRLIGWAGFVLLVSLGIGFIWVHDSLRTVLESENDDLLRRKGAELTAAAQDTYSGGIETLKAEMRREAESYELEGLVVVVRKGEKLIVAPETKESRWLAERLSSQTLTRQPETIEVAGEFYRTMRIKMSSPPQRNSLIDLALSMDEMEAVLAQFDRRVAIGATAFIVLAVVGGWVLANQALRPIARSIHAARQLNPADLSARLPYTGIGDEIDQLAETINELLDRLTTYHDQIIRFTADASHELRGPVSAMRATVDVVLQQPRTIEIYSNALESLGEQCDRLTSLVNSLLLLARADSGEIEIHHNQVDFSALVSDVVEMYRPLIEERGVQLNWQKNDSADLLGDARLLRQLVCNLIDNAGKFTNSGGRVDVRVQQTDDRTTLIVADTGIGISSAHLPHIFDRFYQADSARCSDGTGLGLSICRWIVTAHNGEICLDSHFGLGSTFTVVLKSPSTGC